MSDCHHMNFAAQVNVNRIDCGEDKPMAYSADVYIHCAECGEKFTFLGMGMGLSPAQPMTSPDGCEARLPICPASSNATKIGLFPGFSLTVKDGE